MELVTAARFVCQTVEIPETMKSADLTGYISGVVEDEAPLPLEHIAWGFMAVRKGKRRSTALAYATARSLVLEDNEPDGSIAVVPAFAALHGLSFSQRTWLFFLDDESLSAVSFPPNELTPDRIISRYHDTDRDDWTKLSTLRQQLYQEAGVAERDKVQDGIIRASVTDFSRNRKISFSLEIKTATTGKWHAWRKTELAGESFLLGADLRDPDFLSAERTSRRDGRSFLIAMGGFAAAVLIMIVLEIVLSLRADAAEEALVQAEAQESAVEQLKEMEAMTKALEATLQTQLLPFDWMLAVNEGRPEAIALTSAYMGAGAQMSLSGEADNIKTINDYVTALKESNRFTEVDLADVKTAKTGAIFRIRLVIGNLNAVPASQTENSKEMTEI